MNSSKIALESNDVFTNNTINANLNIKNSLSKILKDCHKAYMYCRNVFHQYFNQRMKILISHSLDKFNVDEYMTTCVNRTLNDFIDECVLYKLELKNDIPDYKELLYSFDNPVLMDKSVDDVFEELVYRAYPVSLVIEFKDALEMYVKDENVIDLFISKLENDMDR